MTQGRAYGTCDGCGCPILPDAAGSLRNHCASCIDTDPMMQQLRREAAEAGEDLDAEVAKLEEEVRRDREIHDGDPQMHTGPMPDSAGTFDEPIVSNRPCPKCGGKVTYQAWDSNDGSYTDYKYTCTACGKVWWVDGIDS